MISDPNVAKMIVDRTFALTSGLDESVAQVLATCPEAEQVTYRRAVGAVMSEAAERILYPLLRQHPELVPASWSSWFK